MKTFLILTISALALAGCVTQVPTDLRPIEDRLAGIEDQLTELNTRQRRIRAGVDANQVAAARAADTAAEALDRSADTRETLSRMFEEHVRK